MFVSLQFKLELKKKGKGKLIKLMRKQSLAIRIAYNMLKELEKEKTKNLHAQIYQRLRQLFPDLNYPSKCSASSEGSPSFPYSWKGLTKRPFFSEVIVGGRGVG
ncbi:MAG: hypothetical protein JHC21_03475 [Thermocrinis sp.]|nr:hypothetical protein [Thermocrinis sp.]